MIKKISSQDTKTSSIKCFKCLGFGHIVSNCPSKRNMFLNARGEFEREHSSPASSPKSSPPHISSSYSSEDEIKPQEGDLLVVRHMLGQIPK